MKRTWQNTYVERELIRRHIEKRQRVIDNVSKAVNALIIAALVFCIEVVMFALLLM